MANLTLPLLGAPVTIIDINGNVVTFPQTTISNGGGSVVVNADGSITITSLVSGTTLTGGLTVDKLTISTAVGQVIPGATSLSFRDNANANDNLIITNAGVVTIRGGLTVTAGGLTVSAGNITNTGQLNQTGGTVNLNQTGGQAVNIAASTNSGTVTIGNSAITALNLGAVATAKMGFWGAAAVVQPAASADTHTVAAGSTTNVFTNTTFDGTLGSSAYTVGGIVHALKLAGIIAS